MNKSNNNGAGASKATGALNAIKSFFLKIGLWFKICFVPFFTRNHKRNLKATIAIVSCFCVLFFISAMIYANGVLKKINYSDSFAGNADATFDDVVDENINYESMYDVSDADSLNALIKSWATNKGEKMYSRNVVNVLLIGEDEDDGSRRSDSMILVSLNKKTKQIILTSFLRDSYTYMEIGDSERFDKTNHSYAWGGAEKLIEVIENNYKIEIDHYATIDFSSFKKAINAVGGVDVPVTEKEAKFMNDTTHFDDFKSGDSVHLDGAHALIFARIRHLDGEAERTDRQKLVIKALIDKAKSASVSQLNNLADQLLPYITTNYSKREIVSLGSQALSKGWLDYPIITQTMPTDACRKEATMNTWSYRNLFVWIVDYPMAAQELQKSIFGSSNIKIDPENHKSALDMLVIASPEQTSYEYTTNSYNGYGYNGYGSNNGNYGYGYNYGNGYGNGYNYGYNYDYTVPELTTKRQYTWKWSQPSSTEPTQTTQPPVSESTSSLSEIISNIIPNESKINEILPQPSDNQTY